MGIIKDSYDIFFDLVDRITGQKKKKKRLLSENLSRIALLLDRIREKFHHKEIPRREAHELRSLTYNAHQMAMPFKEKHPELAAVFEKRFQKIDNLMQLADYFIKEELMENHLSNDKKNLVLSFTAENQIEETIQELERVAGILTSYSNLFKDKGE
jgi:3-methyladenine DNA glycosylase AlkC